MSVDHQKLIGLRIGIGRDHLEGCAVRLADEGEETGQDDGFFGKWFFAGGLSELILGDQAVQLDLIVCPGLVKVIPKIKEGIHHRATVETNVRCQLRAANTLPAEEKRQSFRAPVAARCHASYVRNEQTVLLAQSSPQVTNAFQVILDFLNGDQIKPLADQLQEIPGLRRTSR